VGTALGIMDIDYCQFLEDSKVVIEGGSPKKKEKKKERSKNGESIQLHISDVAIFKFDNLECRSRRLASL